MKLNIRRWARAANRKTAVGDIHLIYVLYTYNLSMYPQPASIHIQLVRLMYLTRMGVDWICQVNIVHFHSASFDFWEENNRISWFAQNRLIKEVTALHSRQNNTYQSKHFSDELTVQPSFYVWKSIYARIR